MRPDADSGPREAADSSCCAGRAPDGKSANAEFRIPDGRWIVMDDDGEEEVRGSRTIRATEGCRCCVPTRSPLAPQTVMTTLPFARPSLT